MSGKRTSRAKLPRSSSRPGVIQLRPCAQPATVGGWKRRWPSEPVASLKSGTPGTSVSPSRRYVETTSSTGLLMCVPTAGGL